MTEKKVLTSTQIKCFQYIFRYNARAKCLDGESVPATEERSERKIRFRISGQFNAIDTHVPGADQGFQERGFICIKGWGFTLVILSRFS